MNDSAIEIARLVLEYIKVLLWPSLVVVGFIYFRNEVRQLAATLSHLKLPGGAEFDWEKKLQEAEDTAEHIEERESQLISQEPDRGKKLSDKANRLGFQPSISHYNPQYIHQLLLFDNISQGFLY